MAFLPTRPGAQGRAFFPLVFRLALKIEQLQWSEFTEDASLATFTLRNTQRLFKSMAVINWFDGWLEAEGAGIKVERDGLGEVIGTSGAANNLDADQVIASGSVQYALDVARRLSSELGDTCATVGYITGPTTLAQRLGGGDTAAICTQHARALCEAGCGALLMVEHEPVGTINTQSYSAAINVAAYYGKAIGLLSRQPLASGDAAAARAAGFSIVVPSDSAVTLIPATSIADAAAPSPGAPLLMTDWEVSVLTAPESLIRLSKEAA